MKKLKKLSNITVITNGKIYDPYNENNYHENILIKNGVIREIGQFEIPKNADLHPKQGTNWWNCKSPQSQSPPKETNVKRETKDKLPALPASDPEHLVLSRVRFLLNNPQELPPHHILFSNSECIAVWCKTGEFMTMN